MNSTRSIRHALPALALAYAVSAAAQSGPPSDPLVVYHAFSGAGSGDWSSVTVPVDPSAWHVGRPDGPAATRSQFDAVLASLRLVVVGANCRGLSAGATHRPCSFELAAPADRTSQGALRIERQWASLSGDLLTRYDGRGAPASVLVSSNPDQGPAAPRPPILPTTVTLDATFVGLYTPSVFDADSARTLSFRFRVHASQESSAKHPAPAAGLLILSTTTGVGPAASVEPTPRAGAPA